MATINRRVSGCHRRLDSLPLVRDDRSGLVYVIVGWALATGVLKILSSIQLRAEVENGWLLAGSGALSVLFGVILALLANSGVPFLAPLIGGFALVVGLALIVFAFRLRERNP